MMLTHQVFRRQRDVIEQTEAHRLIRFGMMSRWPDSAEGARHIPRHHLVTGRQDTARRERSHMVALGTDVRVG